MSQTTAGYPRVLIIGQSFEATTGGGITLTNHFSGWPPERLAVATVGVTFSDFRTCRAYYHLGGDDLAWTWPLSQVARSREPSQPIVARSEARHGPIVVPVPTDRAKAAWRRTAGDAFRAGVRALGLAEFLTDVRASQRFTAWVDEFSPDVVYTQLASITLIRLVSALLDKRPLPLVVHIMDDWPSVIYLEGPLGRLLNRRARREFEDLLGRTDRLMAISKTMADEYSSRYGREVTYSHNPVDLAVWNGNCKTAWSAGRTFRFAYAGRVGQANARSLGELAACIALLAQRGRDVTLDIYTQDAATDLCRGLATDRVTVHGAVPHGEVPALLANADGLVLPLDADHDGFTFSRLSMPTKTAEYMASGAPIVVYSPRGSALAAYAAESSWGLLVDDGRPGSLVAALERLVDDEALRRRVGLHAREVACANHDARRVRERFRESLLIGASPHD